MGEQQRKSCPDCQTEMHPIKLLDATNPGASQKGIQQIEMEYASPDAKSGWWLKKIPKAGTVKAKICPECGRIILHGEST